MLRKDHRTSAYKRPSFCTITYQLAFTNTTANNLQELPQLAPAMAKYFNQQPEGSKNRIENVAIVGVSEKHSTMTRLPVSDAEYRPEAKSDHTSLELC